MVHSFTASHVDPASNQAAVACLSRHIATPCADRVGLVLGTPESRKGHEYKQSFCQIA